MSLLVSQIKIWLRDNAKGMENVLVEEFLMTDEQSKCQGSVECLHFWGGASDFEMAPYYYVFFSLC